MKKTVVFHSYVNVSLPEGSNVLYMHHLRHAAIQHQSQEEHGACEERISSVQTCRDGNDFVRFWSH
jgi:hypothetical protein